MDKKEIAELINKRIVALKEEGTFGSWARQDELEKLLKEIENGQN